MSAYTPAQQSLLTALINAQRSSDDRTDGARVLTPDDAVWEAAK
jgi:hypothetical protein